MEIGYYLETIFNTNGAGLLNVAGGRGGGLIQPALGNSHKSTKINTFFTKLLHNSNHNYPSIHLPCKKIRKIGVLALKMTVFASASLEAEIPRFSDQNQKNSKNA